MRKTIGLVIAAVMVACSWVSAHAHTHRETSCRYRTLDGREGWSQHEVRKTIECAVQRYGVALAPVLEIAQRESGLRAEALNPYSGACGVFQQIPSYWPGRRSHHNRVSIDRWDVAPDCTNARANVLVSVRMMSQGGWSHWGT